MQCIKYKCVDFSVIFLQACQFKDEIKIFKNVTREIMNKRKWHELFSPFSLSINMLGFFWREVTFEFVFLQVNLCQKHSFFHQVTHNKTTDWSLNYKFSARKLQVQYMLCTIDCFLFVFVLTFKTIDVHNMYCTCSFRILNSQFNEQ